MWFIPARVLKVHAMPNVMQHGNSMNEQRRAYHFEGRLQCAVEQGRDSCAQYHSEAITSGSIKSKTKTFRLTSSCTTGLSLPAEVRVTTTSLVTAWVATRSFARGRGEGMNASESWHADPSDLDYSWPFVWLPKCLNNRSFMLYAHAAKPPVTWP